MRDADLRRVFRRLCLKNRINVWSGHFESVNGEDAFKIFKLGVEYGDGTPETEESLFNRTVQAASEIED